MLTSYYQHEGGLYWSRSNSFLVANSIMLALVARMFFDLERGYSLENFTALAVCLLGLFLASAWQKALLAGEFWIHHWSQHLDKLEKSIFDNHSIFKFEPDANYPPKVSAKMQAHFMLRIFVFAWFSLYVFVFYKTFLQL